MLRRVLAPALLLLTAALGAPEAAAQGGTQVLGGGCQANLVPTFTGPFAPGNVASFDDPGCFLGQGGAGLMLLGTALPANQWIPIRLETGLSHFESCDLVLIPLATLDVTPIRFPWRIQIPTDPTLSGGALTVQLFCNQCGFAGCFPTLTRAVEITFG